MKKSDNRKRIPKPRVEITDRDIAHLFDIHATRSVGVMAKRSGLPYLLVYNIVHGRVKTVSDRHFQLLFGEHPPAREPRRVDGGTFRAMVVLWMWLNDDVSHSDLYREFYGSTAARKSDTRIFTGAVRTVPYRLERIMREKFAAAGLDDRTLIQWLDEMDTLQPVDPRVAYAHIRPKLMFLHDRLGIHPTALLHQPVDRYESGLLKRVPRPIYDRVVQLSRKAEEALATGDPRMVEKIKEDFSGKKAGYTLFVDVAEELQFLIDHGQGSAKSYLGRSLWMYRTGHAKRIPDWRAQRIRKDCDRLIRQRPDLPLRDLPRSRRPAILFPLLNLLVARTTDLLSEKEGLVFEKRVLRPLHQRNEYRNPYHGFTRFDMASSVLGMKPRAFDLMVARNCDIFRSVGRYAERWYLSDLYLRELSQNEFFELITAKYELMARSLRDGKKLGKCLSQ